MPKSSSYHQRKEWISWKISSLLIRLDEEPSEYDEIAPKIKYWIEYVLREEFLMVDELVEEVSYVAWDGGGSAPSSYKYKAVRGEANVRKFR